MWLAAEDGYQIRVGRVACVTPCQLTVLRCVWEGKADGCLLISRERTRERRRGEEAALPTGEASQDSENGACAASTESKAPAQRESPPRNSSPMFPNVSSDSLASSRNICNTARA
ncbi:hypothetical protein K0M31_011920, partial [Melipona bicolor]